MLKLAIYGKGGSGKSTTTANLAYALALQGHKVLQIGCDPKADSTLALHPGQQITPVLELLQTKKGTLTLDQAIHQGEQGIYCVEPGGPIPGLGCAGRGIAMVLEDLKQQRALEVLGIDCVLYDVLGDVVCGGFAQPMHRGYAKHVLIITSNEPMSIYAARNISKAVQNFQARSYASLAGFILNDRSLDIEQPDCAHSPDPLTDLATTLQTKIWAHIPYSHEWRLAERSGRCLLQAYPDIPLAQTFKDLAAELFATFN